MSECCAGGWERSGVVRSPKVLSVAGQTSAARILSIAATRKMRPKISAGKRHIDRHALGSGTRLDLLASQMGVAELANAGAKRAGQSGAGLVQLHHVSDVCELGKLELVGQPAKFGVRGLLFEPSTFECGPDMDEERYIA